MGAIKKIYIRSLELVVIVCILGILALICANVFLRYVFNTGIFLAEGISSLFFVWMTFVGAILVLYDGEHIGVDTLVRRLSLPLRRICFVIIHLIMIYATWLLLQGSWVQAMINLNTIAAATRLPIAMLYLAGVVFSVASGAFLISQLGMMLAGRLADDRLVVSAGEDDAEAEQLTAELAHPERSGHVEGAKK